MKCTLDKHQTSPGANHVVACVATVFLRFRSKELGTRVKAGAKNGVSKRAGTGWGKLWKASSLHSNCYCVRSGRLWEKSTKRKARDTRDEGKNAFLSRVLRFASEL